MSNGLRARSDSSVELVNFMGGDDSVAMSAWISFGNDREDRLNDRERVKGLINFLMREKHMTPFESSVFTFRVEAPLFVVREIQRHRTLQLNEYSGRYSKMLPEFYTPERKRPIVQAGRAGDYHFTPGDDRQYSMVDAVHKEVYDLSWKRYEELLQAGVAKEVARMHLPLAMYSSLYITVSARNLAHFLNLRMDEQALYEIRDVAGHMDAIFKEKMPFTHEAWEANNGKS